GRNDRRRHLVFGAVAYGCVVLSHFLVALYFTPLLLAWVMLTVKRARWAQSAIGLVLGIGLSAFVWLPVVFEGRSGQLEKAIQGSLGYSNHFLRPDQLIDTAWGYGSAKSFGIGWGLLLLTAIAWIRRGERCRLWFFTAAAAVFCLLATQPVGWIWEWL